jgi:hypothetical protein
MNLMESYECDAGREELVKNVEPTWVRERRADKAQTEDHMRFRERDEDDTVRDFIFIFAR